MDEKANVRLGRVDTEDTHKQARGAGMCGEQLCESYQCRGERCRELRLLVPQLLILNAGSLQLLKSSVLPGG